MPSNDNTGPYPDSKHLVGPEKMPETKIDKIITNEIPEWKVSVSSLPENPFKVRIELYRVFKFKSFMAAIDFMKKVAPNCDVLNHHPRWENIWRTVVVYTTTWDIGHRISDRDLQMAKLFDKEYDNFEGADKNYKPKKTSPRDFIGLIKDLISENKLKEVTDKVKEYLELNSMHDKINEIILFKSELTDLKKSERKKTKSSEQLSIEYNNFKDRLLKFIDDEIEI